MSNFPYGSNSPKSFLKYPLNVRADFDLEAGGTSSSSSSIRKPRKTKSLSPYPVIMLKKLANQIHYYYKLHPLLVFCISLSIGLTILIVLTVYESNYNVVLGSYSRNGLGSKGDSPFANLKNLVMVAGHSVYTSRSCGRVDDEGSWFLESYQKHAGQAATFLDHIREGVEITGKDDEALLLFSGGETRKDAGPRSEAQSYWIAAESKDWFGRQDTVRWRALTEEHARDSFENLLFSVCRFRELTGTYPQNITVVSYDFKEDRFAHLHRSALKFPEDRFFYSGTPASSTSKEAAIKGEVLVKAQFQDDPYGCLGPLRRKKLGRDPFHRSIPYPNGCPEMKGLFRYCGAAPYPGSVPW